MLLGIIFQCLVLITSKVLANPSSFIQPVLLPSSYSAAAWIHDQKDKSTTLDNQLIVFPKLLSESQCQELETYVDERVTASGRVRDILHDPDSLVHHIMKEEADIFSTMMASSFFLEYYDEVTYAKEQWKDYNRHVGAHYDTMVYGADASHKILIYLDDVAGTNFWPSREDYEHGIPPTYVTPTRGSVVIFSMSLYHSSKEFYDNEAAIKRTLGLRITPLHISNMCPLPPASSPSAHEASTYFNTSALQSTYTDTTSHQEVLILPHLLSEASCRKLEVYLDTIVQEKNRSRGLISIGQETVMQKRRKDSHNTALHEVMMEEVDAPSFLSSSIEYTDVVTYAKETGYEYDKYVGPHADEKLNDATHKLVVYLDDDVGRDEFWPSEAAYRRMESPCSIVESSRGQVIIYALNTFHDSTFYDQYKMKRSLGVRIIGINQSSSGGGCSLLGGGEGEGG